MTDDLETKDVRQGTPRPAVLLIVEDNVVWRTVIRLLLYDIRPDVILLEAGTWAEGIHLAESHHPGAVILDLILPDSPLDHTAANWRLFKVPVVFLSSTTKRTLVDGTPILPKEYEFAKQGIRLAIHAAELEALHQSIEKQL